MDPDQKIQLVNFLLNLLAKTPENAEDAFRLYNNIIDKIAHHLVTKLSDDDEKGKMMEKLIDKILQKKITMCM